MAEREIYFIRAMYEGLRDAMREDQTVMVIGEDVDRSIIGATRGLIDEFGPERVRNTPISEATFVGACIGAAAVGLRPVVDLMVGSFFYVAMDQVANQAAKLPYMSGGQVSLPIVYFTATGPFRLCGRPALREPASDADERRRPEDRDARDAVRRQGLMLAAICEPIRSSTSRTRCSVASRGPCPRSPMRCRSGVGEVKREGDDVTVVAIGASC